MIAAIALLASAAAPETPATSVDQSWQTCGLALGPGEGVDTALQACVAASGTRARQRLELRLGQPFTAVTFDPPARVDSTGFVHYTDTPTDIVWTIGPNRFEFTDVGGTGAAVLTINRVFDQDRVGWFAFAWQNRPLSLTEALTRAQALRAKLEQADFRPPVTPDADRAFTVTDEDRRPDGRRAGDWAAAAALLADERAAVTRMALYTLQISGGEIRVALLNRRRAALNFGDRSPKPDRYDRTVYDRNGGYEWQLDVEVAEPELLPR